MRRYQDPGLSTAISFFLPKMELLVNSTAAAGLRPHQSRPSRREPRRTSVVATSHHLRPVAAVGLRPQQPRPHPARSPAEAMPHRVVLLVPGLVAFAACVVVRLLIWVSGSPLAQDSSWSRTAPRIPSHSLSRSVATRPSRHTSDSVTTRLVSIPVTARHGSRALSKDSRSNYTLPRHHLPSYSSQSQVLCVLYRTNPRKGLYTDSLETDEHRRRYNTGERR